MPVLDWSATAAWIALIVAIASPVVTTIITCKHQREVKKMEVIGSEKMEVISSYLKSASESSCQAGITDDFAQYRGIVLLYAPEGTRDKIIQLNEKVASTKFDDSTSTLLYQVAAELSTTNNRITGDKGLF